ncbi:dnaJ homolog subfamily C member 4 isoform X2 [Anolis carolinensis]|uniref:dnaJ homolog subfamily C member 4 isoform X2 n=1 Tax=Anolis carolinensis TaxID=28377 RepID=UPI002F2B7334
MISAVPYFICRYCQQCQSTRHRHRAFSTTLCNWLPARNSSYYDLLGIKPEASLEEIKQAFFSKSKKLHPDSDPANPDLHSQFVKLNEAYRVLSKEGSRRRYDNLRGAQAAWTPPGSHSAKGSPFDFADFRARKLEEVHNSFMDEKDRAITQIYNENKERARDNLSCLDQHVMEVLQPFRGAEVSDTLVAKEACAFCRHIQSLFNVNKEETDAVTGPWASRSSRNSCARSMLNSPSGTTVAPNSCIRNLEPWTRCKPRLLQTLRAPKAERKAPSHC